LRENHTISIFAFLHGILCATSDEGRIIFVTVFDSFALINALLLTWGFWLLTSQQHYSRVDCFLFSQLVLLAMGRVQMPVITAALNLT
jgi:hypothetical protein